MVQVLILWDHPVKARRNGKKNGSLNGVEVNKRSVIEEEDDEDEEKLEMQVREEVVQFQ